MPTTPVDTPISALPPNPGVTPSDVVEVLDVSNTTNQPTGENTKATVASLVTGLPAFGASGTAHAPGLVPDPGATGGTTRFLREDATFAVPAGGVGGGSPGGATGAVQYNNAGSFGGVSLGAALQVLRVNAGATGLEFATPSGGGSPFVGAGTGHAAGQVPDPGATAHATPYLLGDDGQFHPIAGTALSYAGGTFTFTAGTGGSGTPGGSTGQLQYNNAGAFGGAANLSLGSGGEAIFGPIADPSSPAAGSIWQSNVTKSMNFVSCGLRGPSVILGYQALSPSTPVGVNSTSFGSMFLGITTFKGSLVFPAGSLIAGKIIVPRFWGTYTNPAAAGTITMQILLGGVVIGTCGTPVTLANAATANGWQFEMLGGTTGYQVQVGGSGGKIAGGCRVNMLNNGALVPNTSGTTNGANVQISIDLSVSLAFDIVFSFATPNPGNSIGLLGGWLEVWG